MRSLITLCMSTAGILLTFSTYGQVRLGIKGGLSVSQIPTSTMIVRDEGSVERYHITVDEAKYGIHMGLFVQAQAGKFVFQPEFLFNTVTFDYAIDELLTSTPRRIRDEHYRNLDFPVLIGLKFGPLRINAGPVGHLFLDSTSDLDVEGMDRPDFDRLTWGVQGGLGLDIWKLHLDMRYERNFNRYGEHFRFYGQPYAYPEHPARWVVSAGISF